MTHPPRRLQALLAALLLAGSSLANPATPLPELGDASASVLSLTAEQALGAQAMHSLQQAGALLDDPEVDAYLDSLGRRLLAADPASDGQAFHFFVVDDREINAFALPGGYIGINRGLILASQSESELASVLAHEISHVTQHHIARQLAARSGSQLLTTAALLATVVAAASGNGQAAMAAASGATAAQLQSQINYTREHEHEADRIGFQHLADAGFDPRAMAAFFERLQRSTRLMDGGSTPAYLRSHPLTHERIAEAEDRAFSRPYRQVPDSREYPLVRALLRSYEGSPQDAVARFAGELAEGRHRDRNATRYGLAAAQLRAGNFTAAEASLQALEADGIRHPMFEALAGQTLMQAGRLPEARRRYEQALERYPQHLQLVRDYPQLLIKLGDMAAAARFAESRLPTHPGDASLHRSAAEAWAALGNEPRSHLHLGESYAARGDTRAAVEQLELAVRSPDAGTRDLLVADARLKALREQANAPASGRGDGRRIQPKQSLYPDLRSANRP